MAGLQRSAVSFRRQGSSGLVWEDKLLSGELIKHADQQTRSDQPNPKDENSSTAAADPRPATLVIERSRSNGKRAYRTGRVPPSMEPPSPRVSACGFCGAFGKSSKSHRRPPPALRKRVM